MNIGKPRLSILCTIVLLIVAAGAARVWWSGSHRVSPSITSIKAPEPEKVVRGYFEAVTAAKPQDARQYLVGTALAVFERSVAGRQDMKGAALSDLTIRWPVSGQDVAVCEATATVRQIDKAGDTVTVDAARFYLHRMESGWRIYAYEPIPLPYRDGELKSEAAVAVTRQYLQAVMAGEYETALRFLGGQARIDAESSLPQMKLSRIQMNAKNMQVSAVDAQAGAVWVKASYDVSLAGEKTQPVTLLLETRQVDHTWVVVKSNIVSR